MKLYRLDTECPACGHRPYLRLTEWMMEAVAHLKPSSPLIHWTCGEEQTESESTCGTRFPIRAGAMQRAVFIESARVGEDPQPESPLSPRESEVCALVVQGYSDRRITQALGITRPTVRYHIGEAARKLCDADGTVCHTFPRRTIQAYYLQQTNALPPARIFILAGMDAGTYL